MSWTDLRAWLTGTLREALWAPAVVLVFWAVAARGFHVYIRYPWLDMPTHFSGGVAFAHFLWVAIRRLEGLLGPIHALFRALLVLGVTALAAVAWEFLEFLSDLTLGSHLNLGVTDTLSDLFFGILGGLCAVVVHLLWNSPSALPRLR